VKFTAGKQWMWKFQHPRRQREIHTLHLPTGRDVKSRYFAVRDPSFFVPAFRVKQMVCRTATSLPVQRRSPPHPGKKNKNVPPVLSHTAVLSTPAGGDGCMIPRTTMPTGWPAARRKAPGFWARKRSRSTRHHNATPRLRLRARILSLYGRPGPSH